MTKTCTGMSVEDHGILASRISDVHEALLRTYFHLADAYGKDSKQAKTTWFSITAIAVLRQEMDATLFQELTCRRESMSIHLYYPGKTGAYLP
jgi:hypothetical protein